MTNSKSTKRALLGSAVSLLLCFAMLIGTTFAWFTDSASTGVNKIQSGNLDIDVLYATPSDVVDGEIPDGSWKPVSKDSSVFNKNALWEPGYTEVVYFKFVNNGSLSLQFQMHVDILNEIAGTNVAGKTFNLSDYIEAYVCGATANQFVLYNTRDVALNPPYAPEVFHGSLKEVANMAVATPDDQSTWLSLDTWNWLEPKEEYYCTTVLFMPTTVGNEANHNGTDIPSIDLGIDFIATQYNWENEKDSYDHNYDENATYPARADYYVTTADMLVEALENAKNPGDIIGLRENIKIEPASMSNAYGKTGINVKNGQIIDGNGYTLDIKGAGGTWDSGINTTGGTIKNLTVTGSFRGIFINHNSTHSEPVILENVTIDGTTYTISCDQGTGKGLTATNSTFNGWTSYAATIGNVEFTSCSFGEGNGYAYCRPYAPTAFVGCDFEAGYEMDPRAAVTFENCTIGGVALTADNLATLVTSNISNATVK